MAWVGVSSLYVNQGAIDQAAYVQQIVSASSDEELSWLPLLPLVALMALEGGIYLAVLAFPRLATLGPGCHPSRARDGLLVAWRVELRVVLFILCKLVRV